MAKYVTHKLKFDKANVFKFLFVSLCLTIAAFGAFIISERSTGEGICPWESINARKNGPDEILSHDLAEAALWLGTAIIATWVSTPFAVYSVYTVLRGADPGLVTFILGFTPIFSTTVMLPAVFFRGPTPVECILQHHNSIVWFILALLPLALPILCLSMLLMLLVGYVIVNTTCEVYKLIEKHLTCFRVEEVVELV